ncbi:hypothetical protein Tco_0760282 [Tanacetum coccineum]
MTKSVTEHVEGKGSGQPTKPQYTTTTASSSHVEPIPTITSSSHPKKTHKCRKTKRKATEISQSSRPTTLVANETTHEERAFSMERAATTTICLDAEQGSGSGPRCQDTILGDRPAQTRFERLSKQSNDPHLSRVNTLGSREDSMIQQELMVFCITLPKKVESLETNLKGKIAKIDQDPSISLIQHDGEIQGRYGHDMEFDFDFDAAKEVSTAGAAVTTASVAVSIASPTRNTRVSTADDITMAETLVYIRRSATKDIGKAPMRLQVELEEEERQRIARADEELAQRLEAEEREKYTKAEQARMLA